MKHYLVPTDFSDIANKACEFAIKLALHFDAEVLFLHAYEVPYSGKGAGSMKNLDQIHRNDAKKRLDKFESKIKEAYPNLKYKLYNDASLPVDSIKWHCREKDFDLLIMGTAGASGVVDDFIGSTTSNIIGKVDIPILAIPKNAEVEFPKNILIATDLRSTNYIEELNPIVDIAQKLNSKVNFINVKNPNDEVKEFDTTEIASVLDSNFGSIHLVESEDIETGLTNFVEENEVDLLTVVAHNKSLWEKLWNKSMSKSLVKHSTIPVLVLPHK